MWNSLFDYWKELSLLSVSCLPLIGLFFLSSKTVNWTTPFGYFTQLKVFIKKGASEAAQTSAFTGNSEPQEAIKSYQLVQVSNVVSSGSNSADLLIEYPLTSLDKESNWRYCLPIGSQLNKESKASASQKSQLDCSLQRNNSTETSEVKFLLNLGLKFLKLQHQMNLILLYHLGFKNSKVGINTEIFDWKQQVLDKCRLKQENYDLKDFLVSIVPISKKCLLTPSKAELILTINETSSRLSSNDIQEIKLDNLKKASMKGNIEYSFSNYYGKLHNFSWPMGTQGNKDYPISISLKTTEKFFEFNLGSGSSNGNSKLDFNTLWKKYSSRELVLCDFWKNATSGGEADGQAVNCQEVNK